MFAFLFYLCYNYFGDIMYCCFTGHRPQSLPWKFDEISPLCMKIKTVLYDLTEQSILDGYTDFYCGMARGIDTYAAEAVIKSQNFFEGISLHAALPCPNQYTAWAKGDCKRYDYLLSKCATRTLISPYYSQSCMITRNKFMVDNSLRVIAVWNGSLKGGTAFTVRYAKNSGKEIYLVNPFDLSVTVI